MPCSQPGQARPRPDSLAIVAKQVSPHLVHELGWLNTSLLAGQIVDKPLGGAFSSLFPHSVASNSSQQKMIENAPISSIINSYRIMTNENHLHDAPPALKYCTTPQRYHPD